MGKVKILVSSIGLPAEAIGSWVIRIQKFQENTRYFDHILSPGSRQDSVYSFCQKQPESTLDHLVPERLRGQRRVQSYLDTIKKISGTAESLQVLVMDDQLLLREISKLKSQLDIPIELVFSYHGHSLYLDPNIYDFVDKVFFLTKSGYRASLRRNQQFTPLAYVVGNGVDSTQFFPLANSEKMDQRLKFGFGKDDLILLWMANSRRVKGLHLFKKLVGRLLERHSSLQIISIGHEPDANISMERWKQVGRIPNEELPAYLQIGDVYCFTSLWEEGFGLSLAEAAKCGNWILASNNGGISDVVKDFPNSVLVEDPNFLDNWTEAFEVLISRMQSEIKSTLTKDFLVDWQSYKTWEKRYLNALED